MKLATKISPVVFTQVETIINKYNISGLPLAHFLAQCAHESGNFQFVRENLNYSPEALLKVFPKYFKTLADANNYGDRKSTRLNSSH